MKREHYFGSKLISDTDWDVMSSHFLSLFSDPYRISSPFLLRSGLWLADHWGGTCLAHTFAARLFPYFSNSEQSHFYYYRFQENPPCHLPFRKCALVFLLSNIASVTMH